MNTLGFSYSNKPSSNHARIHTLIHTVLSTFSFLMNDQNCGGVSQEHENRGERECANWMLSVVMDGSCIISMLRLLSEMGSASLVNFEKKSFNTFIQTP